MAALATRLKAGLGLDLTAEAVRTPLGIIQRVAVAGLTAEGQKTKDGLELTGVHADAISLRDLNLTAFGRAVTGTGVLIENVSLAGTVGDGVVSVPLVTIGQISGDELRFLSTEAGSQLDVRITHGVLGAVQLTGLTWQPDGQVTGSLTAGTISDVSYTVVTGLFTGTGVLGMASGTGPGQAAPGPGADALRVGFSRGPDHTSITLDAHGLAAIGNHFSSPDGALTVDRTLIDLHGELHDGDITTTLTLSDTEIGAVRWQSGPMSITSPRGTRIKSLTAAVRYLAAQQSSTDPARRTARLLVDNLTIDDFGMSDLHYHDAGQNPSLDIWLGRDAPHPGALQVSRIRLSGFVLPFDAEGHALAGQAAGSIAVTGTQLDARAVQGTFKASGSIDVRSITVEFSQGGKVLTVRGQGIGGDVHVQTPGLDISGQLPVGDEFGGADTGTIRVTPEAIEVKGFRIPYLSLDALEVRGTEAGGPWLRMLEGGGIYVTELEADIRIDRWRPGEKHPPAQPFRRIGLTHAEIEQIDAEGFEFGYPPLGLSITVPVGPAGEKASAASIRLLKLEGQGPDGFILTPGGPDSPVGTLSADSFQIPGLRANIEKRFSGLGQVNGGNLTVGFLAHGMTVVDLNDLTAAAEEGTLGGPGETIAVQRIDVQHAHVAGGKAEVTGLTLHRLQYHRAGMDVEADAEVPGKAEFGARGAKIPKLHIGHGHLVVKFRDLSASSPASGTPGMIPSPRTLTYMLMDRLQGEVPLTVQVRGKHIPHFDLRDIDIRTTVRFDHGKLDLPDLRKQFTDSAIIDPPSGYLSSQVKSARFDLEEGSRLVFHTTVTPQQTLFAWRLEPADVELYQKEQKLRLSSAIIELIPDSANPPRSLTIVLGPATNLSVKNDAPIPVSFSYPGFWGCVVLGRDVLVGLAAQGSITPVDTSGPGTGSLSGIKLEHFTIDQTRLWVGENLITTEAIHIAGARDGMLSLSRTDPIELTLWIDSADAENITWSRP